MVKDNPTSNNLTIDTFGRFTSEDVERKLQPKIPGYKVTEWIEVERAKRKTKFANATHLLAIAIIVTYCVVLFIWAITSMILHSDVPPIPEVATTIVSLVVGFYFGQANGWLD